MDTHTKIQLAELIFKILAGIFAAGWAIYLLLLIHRPLAQAGLGKSKMELEAHQQKKSLLAGLTVSLQATAHRLPGRADFAIIAIVNITNRTESHIHRTVWEQEPLHVWMTSFDAQGRPTYNGDTAFFVRTTFNPNAPAEALRIRPGATELLSFAVRVSTPGIYLVTFRMPLDPKYRAGLEKFGIDEDKAAAWTGRAHVLVGDIPDPLPALRPDRSTPA